MVLPTIGAFRCGNNKQENEGKLLHNSSRSSKTVKQKSVRSVRATCVDQSCSFPPRHEADHLGQPAYARRQTKKRGEVDKGRSDRLATTVDSKARICRRVVWNSAFKLCSHCLKIYAGQGTPAKAIPEDIRLWMHFVHSGRGVRSIRSCNAAHTSVCMRLLIRKSTGTTMTR